MKWIIIALLLLGPACVTDITARREMDCREATVKLAQSYISEASEAHWSLIIGHGVWKDHYENCLKVK